MPRVYKLIKADTGEVVRVIGRLRELKLAVKYPVDKTPDVSSFLRRINEKLASHGLMIVWEEGEGKYPLDVSKLLE
jgi:hypothetical protein